VRRCIEAAELVETETPAGFERASIARLAALSPLEYDRVRKAEADRLEVRVTTLDKEVAKARGEDFDAGSGRRIEFVDPEPWEEAVDGTQLLDDLSRCFSRFLILPQHAGTVLALWTMFTYARQLS
jgi:putative DNA primase/helicase